MVNRQPRGIPVGGQFAANSHDEAAPLDIPWSERTDEQKRDSVESLILETLDRHGKSGWTVRFTQNQSTLGSANERSKTIFISEAQFSDEAQTIDTAMHESAHVLAGAQARHGAVWKGFAALLGAKPSATTQVSRPVTPDGATHVMKTAYGDVSVTTGVTTVRHKNALMEIVEVRKGFVVGRDPSGVLHRISPDMLHENYGDLSKMEKKRVTMRSEYGDFEVVIGETQARVGSKTYTIVEARRTKVVGVDDSGRRVLLPASLLDPVEKKLREMLSARRNRRQ